MKNYLALIFILNCSFSCFSQFNTSDYLRIDVKHFQGKILPHNNIFNENLIKNHFQGIEFRISNQTSKKDEENKIFRFPIWGFAYHLGDFRQIQLLSTQNSINDLGFSHTFYGYYSLSIFKRRKIQLDYYLGIGLAINTKPYDKLTNPHNMLVGTYLNNAVDFGITFDYLIHENWFINAGLSFKHTSNGSFQLPNAGLNLLATSVGFKYKPTSNKNLKKSQLHKKNTFKKKKHIVQITISNSIKMLNEDFDRNIKKRWYVGKLGFSYLKKTTSKRSFGIGTDLSYVSYGNYVEQTKNNSPEYNWQKNVTLALFLAHELTHYRVKLNTDIGVYLFNKTKIIGKAPIYFRLGIVYRLIDQFHLGIAVKSHWLNADVMEYNLGYRIHF